MKILWKGMLGTNHSWSQTSQAYIRATKEIGGHEVYLKSTNGLEHFPQDLRHMLLPGYHGHLSQGATDFITKDGEQLLVTPSNPVPEIPDPNYPYDLEIAYTIPFQMAYGRRFSNVSKCRAHIWNFESSILPAGWQRYMDACDYLLPSSQYSYDIFAANGFPKEKMVVVPHGVDTRVFNPNIPPFELKTTKKVKFLHCARPHDRKLHRRVIRGYLEAFSGDDDVCLVLKTSLITPDPSKIFEVDVRKILEEEYSKIKNPPEIEVVDRYVDHIGSLYTACDAAISMSSCEGFCLLPETLVDTDEGPISASKLEESNAKNVLTHKNHIKPISKFTKRQINEDIFEIRRHGCDILFSGTKNHPQLIIKRNGRSFRQLRKDLDSNKLKASWLGLGEVEKDDLVVIPKHSISDINFINEIDLTKAVTGLEKDDTCVWLNGSYLKSSGQSSLMNIANKVNCSFQHVSAVLNGKVNISTPLNKKIIDTANSLGYSKPKPLVLPKKINVTSDLAKFFGLYIAEGSISSGGKSFNITSHKDEGYGHSISRKICMDLNIPNCELVDGNRHQFSASSGIFSSLLSSWFGDHATNKRIPSFLYNSPYIYDIVHMLFYGDGTTTNNSYSFSTSSLGLCFDLFQILLNNNIFTNILTDKRNDNSNYVITVCAHHNERFYKLFRPKKYDINCFITNGSKNNSIIEGQDYFAVPIRKVSKRGYEGFVYNIEVKNDHSFTSMGMATHNCLPLLEALACDSLVIAPRHGGQLEFLNDNNSLLVNTGEMKAPATQQYWTAHPDAVVGDPDIEHYKELLRYVYENTDKEKERVREAVQKTVEKFNWKDMTQIILDLPIPEKSARIRDKKRTLFIVPYNFVGGGEIWVLEAIKQLDRTKFDPEVAFVSGTTKSFREKIEALDIKTFDVVEESGVWKTQNNGRASTLKVILESRGYELIHFYNSFSIYNIIKETIKQGLKARVVETVHSKLKWPDSMSKVATREPWVTAISAVNNELGQHLVKMKNKNVVVLPQHIDWNKFLGKERNKSVLTKHNVPENKPVVGFVGRLSPEKNIPVILQCAKILPNYSFVIVGDGPEKDKLHKMGGDNVYFVGAQQNVEEYYLAFDLLVLSSVIEGMPLVILEAMSCGTPVVASDVGGIKEIITNEQNGLVIPNARDPRLFAAGIKQIIEDKNKWQQYSVNSITTAHNIKNKCEKININSLYNAILFPKGGK